MAGTLEMVVGAGILILTGILAWGARPTATGMIHRILQRRYVEDYFAVFLMYLTAIGLILIAWLFR